MKKTDNNLKQKLEKEFLSEDHYSKFKNKLSQSEKKKFPFMLVASIVLFLFSAVFFYNSYPSSENKQKLEFSSTKSYFENLIQHELYAINEQGENPVFNKNVQINLDKIKQLDKECKELEQEFIESKYDKIILKQIVENYQLRLKILDKIMKLIEEQKIKNHEENNIL